MNCPVIKTNHYVLRAFERKDLVRFADYRSQESVAQFQSWTDYTYEDAVDLFEGTDYSKFAVVGQWYQLAIALQDNDDLVGDLAVHFIDDEQVELGFTIAPDFQGKGIATEAAKALLAYLFNDLGKHRVVATTDTRNIASYSVLEKLGFRREAHFVQNIFFKGAWGDEYQYALLSAESKLG